MLQTFDKAIKLHQTACFYNELRGYPYIFCTFFHIFENKINQHIKLLSIFAPTKDSK